MNGFDESQTQEPEIDIREFLHLFWSWAWLIALAGLVAGATAYFVSIRTTPVYEASTRLLVSAPSTISGMDPTALVTSQTMTATYSQMLVDRPVLQGVIDQLGLTMTPETLKQSISVAVVTNTQLLEITVQDTSPARAADVANAIATVFADRIRELQSQRYAASRGGLEKQVKDMEEQIAETNKLIAVTTNPATLEQLQARLTQYRTIYSNLVTAYEQVRLAEDQTSTNVIVSEPAMVPNIPVKPRTNLNTILGVLAGLLLAGSAVFAMDALDDTIKNPDEIRRKFNLPILGMIAWHEAADDAPITLNQPRSPVAEAFRSLRTNLIFAGVDRPLRRILITSPTPQDGKTTISSNLAVALAQQGERKVALIDADMRRPQIHHKFGMLNRSGLSDLFVSSADKFERVVQFNSQSNLGVITSGPLPPNPAELLTSLTMMRIMDKVNATYDVILIDTPPVLTVTDAVALASSVDGVVLVVKPGVTKRGAFEQTLEQLRAVGARLLGVVLNEVKPGSRKYGYYYNRYYSKYSHYYEKDGGKKKKSKAARLPQTGADSPLQTDAEKISRL